MKASQAKAFAHKVIGYELCTGCGEDEASQYLISPVARAFIEGSIGTELTPNYFSASSAFSIDEKQNRLGEFFKEVGEALILDAEKVES